MLKIAILGDLIQTKEFGIDPKLLEILQKTDFNIANLEAPFITPECKPANGRSGLYQKQADCELLKKLNIKIVSLANNHIADFGYEGLIETLEVLKKNNILYFGAGTTLKDAEEPAIYEADGIRFSCRGAISPYLTKFLAKEDSFGMVALDTQSLINQLKQDTSDIKIVYNHWNQEFEDYPEPIYKEDAEALIQYADIVAGSHSHCIQGIQKIDGKPIFHSLGNFSLPNIDYFNCRVSKYRPKSYRSFFPLIVIDEHEISYELIPFKLSSNGAELIGVDRENDKDIKKVIKTISKPLNLNSREYLQFYTKHRERKMRKPLTRNNSKNLQNLKRYRFKYDLLHGAEKRLGAFLDKVGLRKGIRKTFKPIIDRIQKTK